MSLRINVVSLVYHEKKLILSNPLISPFVLVCIFILISTAQQVKASGFPGYLDEFCRTAEYIIVAECANRTDNEAKLKVEIVHKAPKSNPKPDLLVVKGFFSTATRFYFEKNKRYFAFIFKDGFCDRQGSHVEITESGNLTSAARELICLEENTDTLDKLTEQVKRILSGKYEKELISRINNKEMSYTSRRTDALALSRANPESAIEAIADLLIEISQQPDVNGSSRNLYMTLFKLDFNRARDISLQILSNTNSFELFFEASDVLAKPQCKIANFEKHYTILLKAAQEWEKSNPNSGYAYMLPVFANNDCRTPEVKRMLLAALSSPETPYFDRISQSTLKMQFPESLQLLWNKIKQQRQMSDLVNLDFYIASQVGASRVYDNENFEQLEVWIGENLIRRNFPEYTKNLAEAKVIRVNKSLLFLVTLDDGESQICLYVGFVRKEQNKIEHQVFVLFDEK